MGARPTPTRQRRADPDAQPGRRWLLTQNSELAEDNVYAWTLPALGARLSDGRMVVTCPNAGVCAALCYARAGTFQFPEVKRAHLRKLEMVAGDLADWEHEMHAELAHPRYAGAQVRIHDSGDFFSRDYAEAWLRLAARHPRTHFYAYTKEVQLFKFDLAGMIPGNFHVIYSMGGKQDHLIDREHDRHAEVFPDLESLRAAGYEDNGFSDLKAYLSLNHRVGIVANNHPHLRRRQGAATFGQLQQQPRLLAPKRAARAAAHAAAAEAERETAV